jgi:ABC-type polysaccharide/polyol phosphate transport system ATPase subunit
MRLRRWSRGLQTAFDDAIEIEFNNVSKRFTLTEGRTLREFIPAFFKGNGFHEPFYALRDVNFQIGRGETVGLIGRNGSGKSTALKLIAGVTAPSIGDVYVGGRVSPLIELGAGFHPDLTGRENVDMNASILGMSGREISSAFKSIVDFAELWDFIDTPVKRYSSGMYIRLAFSVAVHASPEILLVDEVLSVGDAFFQEKCLDRMHQFQREGTTIVIVSHGLELLTSFCERVIWLDHGKVIADGPAAEVVRHYQDTVPHHPEAVA